MNAGCGSSRGQWGRERGGWGCRINLMSSLVCGLAICASAPVKALDPPCYYEVTVLDTVPCGIFGESGQTPYAIADNGWVTGEYPQCDGSGDTWVLLHNSGTAVQGLIPPFAGVQRAEGLDITSNGLVVGWMDIDNVGTRGFRYNHNLSEWLELPGLPGSTFSQALGVNASGVVVGRTGNQVTGPSPLAIMWINGSPVDLASELGTESSEAHSVNDAGMIVGWMGDSYLSARAFLQESDGTIHELVPSGNFLTVQGVAVNRWGDVAGQGAWRKSPGDPTVLHAFTWNPFTGEFVDLGTLPGTTFSRPYDINDRREIVGYCNNSGLTDLTGFYWRDGEMVSVESLDDPSNDIELKLVYGINHLGSITGVASGDDLEATSAVIFERPIPYDLNDDCRVNVNDLLLMLSAWGSGPSVADVTGDGAVSVDDLLKMLANWG